MNDATSRGPAIRSGKELLPDGWDVRRLKFVVSCNDESLPEATNPALEIAYVDISSVELETGIKNIERLSFDEAPSRARRIVRDGDTIVSTVRTYLKAIAAIREPSPDLVVSTGFAVLRPMEELDGRFLAYALQASSFVDAMVANSTGVSYPAINPSELVCLPIPFPHDKGAQEQIAAFLDRKTGQIDVLITKKRELIKKLKEKRLAVITEAVTKGLNPGVLLRNSRKDWLGKIPKHWGVVKLKFIAELNSGHTPARSVDEYWIDCTIPWVSLNDSAYLREHDSIRDTHYQISELGLANSSAVLLPAGVVVLSRDATVGLSAITEVPMAVSQHFIAYDCGEALVSKYLLYCFKAMEQHLRSLQTGTTIATIGMPEIGSLAGPLPPVSEQLAIVDFLDRSTARLDKMVEKVETAMKKLQEYRSALITAAVTGKIDVRHPAIPTAA